MIDFVFFAIAVTGVFAPEYCPVDQSLVSEMLYMVLRMVIVCCGGLVLSKIALEKLSGPIERAGQLLGINNEAVVGLILSLTQSLAMLPLYSRMDRRGQILNAAFSVSGAYVFGGQMAFVTSLVPPAWGAAYMANKLIAGTLALLLAVASVGVLLLVHTSILWGSCQILLEEGDYSRDNKLEVIRYGYINQIYWGLVTAGYLAWSFLTNDWHRTWIVWPVAAVACGAVVGIVKALRRRDG